jgi:hypothetical protein
LIAGSKTKERKDMEEKVINTFTQITHTPEGIAMLIAAILFAIMMTWILIKGAWKALTLVFGFIAGVAGTYTILPTLPPNFQPEQFALFVAGCLCAAIIGKVYKPGILMLSAATSIVAVCLLQIT